MHKGQLSLVVNDTLFAEDRFLRTQVLKKLQEDFNKVSPDIMKYLKYMLWNKCLCPKLKLRNIH